MNNNGQKIFEILRQGERGVYCQSGQVERAVERSGKAGKKVSRYDPGRKLLSERQEILKGMVEDKN